VKLKRIPTEVDVGFLGDISIAWKDAAGRSGIAYVELNSLYPGLDSGDFNLTAKLCMHIVEQNEKIEELNNRMLWLEQRFNCIANAFKGENE
jgi:hypothetical protein